jgi:hypothetical protein
MDVCKRDLKSCNTNPADLQTESSDRSSWRINVETGVKKAEEKREILRKERKSHKQQRTQPITAATLVPTADHTCSKCGRRCSSHIGLFSHNRRCNPTNKYHSGADSIVSCILDKTFVSACFTRERKSYLFPRTRAYMCDVTSSMI